MNILRIEFTIVVDFTVAVSSFFFHMLTCSNKYIHQSLFVLIWNTYYLHVKFSIEYHKIQILTPNSQNAITDEIWIVQLKCKTILLKWSTIWSVVYIRNKRFHRLSRVCTTWAFMNDPSWSTAQLIDTMLLHWGIMNDWIIGTLNLKHTS